MLSFYEQEKGGVPVKGYEDEYLIFNDGRILSKLTDMYVQQSPDTKGYLKVMLYKDGHKKMFRVHVLVALHFIPNPDDLPIVNHIDGNKTNPSYTNLEWATYSENTLHAHKTGLQTKTSNKIVIRSDGKRYTSLTDAAKDTGISKSAISKVLAGVRKSAGGYQWKEEKQEEV